MKIRITRMARYSSMHAVTYNSFTYCSLFLSSSALFRCFSNFFTNWTTKHDNDTQLNLYLYQAWSLCVYVPYNVENTVCDLGLVSDIPWSLYKNKNDNKSWVQFISIYIKQLSCPCTIILHDSTQQGPNTTYATSNELAQFHSQLFSPSICVTHVKRHSYKFFVYTATAEI